MKDFVEGGMTLFWQRQAMFAGVALLTAYYFDLLLAVFCYLLCLVAEAIDLYLSKQVVRWPGGSIRETKKYLALITLSQILSALSIALFAIVISWFEGPALHFTPLFLLFAAALFAAVNNHQLPQLILIKLLIYGASFIFIPLRDLIVVRPAFDSYLWLQFITVVFVLYFVIDCSRIFMKLYRKNLLQFENLKLERDRAMRASEAKSQFLSTVSHELRTPLTSIKGSIDLIHGGAAGKVTPELAPLVELARRNSDRLLLLISELLDLQKMEAGEVSLNFAAVNVSQLVRESINAISHHARTSQIEVSLEINDGELVIWGDYSRLLQVMANLLSNAIKFSAEGDNVKVVVEKRGNSASVVVVDQGIGIPNDAGEILFKPFSQIDSSDTRKVGGTGLGLHITKRILDKHNATIDFKSDVGKGTAFTLGFELLSD
ncbi:sensor histidine kinase [Aliiroseovarius sp. YM-037]|uniref:sensor histidine kinase n=1 Tax=Aliiroseovarius sp. YM-037 TaxID=3341728 RepID=UPI003A8128C5